MSEPKVKKPEIGKNKKTVDDKSFGDSKKNTKFSKNKKPRKKGRFTREKSEFEERVLEVRRVTRVVAGGKRFSFRTTVVLGDRKGKVGVGIGKGLDVVDSINKGKSAAKKNMIKFQLKDERTIPYDVEKKYSAARVRIKPTKEGHGLICGGAARVVLDLAGVKDISAKILGGTNSKLNNAKATIEALKTFEIKK
ncbi:MAG: 30S ribosomal protein S5 [Candidatus Paceibacterota bacterium]